MLQLLLTMEPCLPLVLNAVLVAPTAALVVELSVTKHVQEGCELVVELTELQMMDSHRIFAAHLGDVLWVKHSPSGWQKRDSPFLSVRVHEG